MRSLSAASFGGFQGVRVIEAEPLPPTLIITGGPQDGASIACDPASGVEILGSGDQSPVRITLANVAPIHAQILWEGQQLFIEDAGTSTGTYVNGEKLTDRRAIVEGDRIYLGPPGSADSASLLVCPPADDGSSPYGGELQLDAPAMPSLDSSDPLILEPAGSPFEAPAEANPFELAPPLTLDPPADAAPPPPPIVEKLTAPAPPPAPVGSGTGSIRRPTKGDYNTDIPSIAPDHVREPLALPLIPPPPRRPTPAAATRRPAPRGGGSSIPRMAVIGGVAAVAAIGAVAAYMFMHVPPPTLASVMPLKIEAGGTLTLKGDKFSTTTGRNTVHFGDLIGDVVSASDTDITVRVPADSKPGDVQVSVETKGGRSNSLFCKIFVAPSITGISPEVAMPGQEILISGKNLNTQEPTVLVGGIRGTVLEAQPTSLKVRISSEILPVEGKPLQVSVQVGAEMAKPMDVLMGHLPLLAAVEPTSGAPGSRVTLKGRGFAAAPSDNIVTFGDRRALVLSASPSEVTVAVTGLDTPGSQVPVPLRVAAGGSVSSPANFIVVRSAAGYFSPRFFPLPVTDHPGHGHVFIATDLGPLIVLSAKGGAGLAERAIAATDALNALADTVGGGQSVKIEARDSPPCVAAGGSCIITATPEDAAAYEEPWGKAKGARATPRAVAAHWAALIDDYLTMFLARQRPYRTLETSPRGKTLLELYGESVRRAGAGAGVPVGLVSPLSSRLEADLRELALVLPGESPTKGAGAIEGLWTGTLEEPAGGREFHIRFKLRGAQLEGTLTTSTGQLAMDRPLENLTY
jgi:FHA domain/IPT/TIG domain